MSDYWILSAKVCNSCRIIGEGSKSTLMPCGKCLVRKWSKERKTPVALSHQAICDILCLISITWSGSYSNGEMMLDGTISDVS